MLPIKTWPKVSTLLCQYDLECPLHWRNWVIRWNNNKDNSWTVFKKLIIQVPFLNSGLDNSTVWSSGTSRRFSCCASNSSFSLAWALANGTEHFESGLSKGQAGIQFFFSPVTMQYMQSSPVPLWCLNLIQVIYNGDLITGLLPCGICSVFCKLEKVTNNILKWYNVNLLANQLVLIQSLLSNMASSEINTQLQVLEKYGFMNLVLPCAMFLAFNDIIQCIQSWLFLSNFNKF